MGSGLSAASRGPSMGSPSVLAMWWLVPQSTWPRGSQAEATVSLQPSLRSNTVILILICSLKSSH